MAWDLKDVRLQQKIGHLCHFIFKILQSSPVIANLDSGVIRILTPTSSISSASDYEMATEEVRLGCLAL
ncbi:hypothetical protein BT63DRAFT_425561 [Microthyrium microscopicum]|uniref:Uncharacterized protein n=1 Tax=Microthyrium microscopicum TaxID=703497 RepID=A0A6A6U9W9_9PEZI|nr:hypothetical protein BT63DRAFT_425561 [Microthyrium microscopicum]